MKTERSNQVLVAGGTGALGGAICAGLLRHGAAVRAIVRDASPPERTSELLAAGVDIVDADLCTVSTLEAAVDGVSTVVSTVTCFPRDDRPGAIDRIDRAGNVNLIDAAERADVARFVFVSFKPIPLDFPLQRAKRAVEERLRQAALEAVVLRPGKLMDVWFSPLCGFDVSSARATVFGDGTRPVTWIAAADVAEIAARSALGDGPAQGEVELGGPEALSQQQVIDLYAGVTERSWSVQRISAPLLERQLADGRSEVEASLAALMLEAHLGAVTDMQDTLRVFPLTLTTVSEFATRAVSGL